ncbi:hypothetical protein N7G274_002460 [Stereocaulon virgatum]|uniref:Uncharacterized protein n=1 Tax=Stereocaulon virgatum TaxID=373712 RepID=A0ABR4AIN5_9LECA
MKGVHSSPSVLHVLFITARQIALTAADAGFHRQQCYGRVTEILESNNSSITITPSMFISRSDLTNPILTLDGCQQLCGSGTGWYPDSGPRLVAWLLPIILLISNMQFAPIGMQRYLLILHLLGDPIDSTWSLLAKLDSWTRCLSRAQKLVKEKIVIKSLAIINASAEEVSLTFDYAPKSKAFDSKGLLVEAALTLSENKSNEILRTLLAIVLYVFQVLAAFVPAVGAASSPSGGRIGTAMLLSWLLSITLLSNAIGDFGSLRNCRQIIAVLRKRLGSQSDQDFYTQSTSKLTLSLVGVQMEIQTPNEASMAWSGAIYSYRPNKPFFHDSGWKLAFISVLPVTIAFGTAFAVLDTGPTYFSCRHILVIVVFSVWLMSALSTSLLSWASFATGKYLWHIILIKDAVIATTTLALIVTSSCGLWNTCYCWSGALVYGERRARVPLNPATVFDRNNRVVYPAMVATGLSLQVCVFGAMLWVGWPGFRALWWSENEKRAALDMRRDTLASSSATQTDTVDLGPPRDLT